MSSTVVFPDAELIAVEYLRDDLAFVDDPAAEGVTVGTRKPSPMPAGPVVQVRRIGGLQQTAVTEVARLDLIIWHTSDKAAQDLIQIARGLLGRHRRDDGLGAEDFAAPYRADDPDSDQPRYVTTVEIVTRGSTLESASS